MGLFWSLKQLPNQRIGLRLTPRDVRQPMKMDFCLRKGHVSQFSDQSEAQNPEWEATIERYFIHPATERIPIRRGRIRGVMYRPKGRHCIFFISKTYCILLDVCSGAHARTAGVGLFDV